MATGRAPYEQISDKEAFDTSNDTRHSAVLTPMRSSPLQMLSTWIET